MQWWQVFIAICSASVLAGFAGSFLARAFVYSRDRKRISELETEVAVLTSEYSKVLGLAKKISQRVALDDHRHKSSRNSLGRGEPPPPGDKKAAKQYYLFGKTHQQIAREAMNGAEQ